MTRRATRHMMKRMTIGGLGCLIRLWMFLTRLAVCMCVLWRRGKKGKVSERASEEGDVYIGVCVYVQIE
jgi:hypothetical protein